MLKSYLVGESAVRAELDALGPNLRKELMVGIGRLSLNLATEVKGKLNGQVLNVRTNRLRNSIKNMAIVYLANTTRLFE